VVVLDEAIGEIHGRCPRLAGQQQAARRVKVDAVGRGEPESRAARPANRLGGTPWARVKARENASMAS
jgi:hypothetical protein